MMTARFGRAAPDATFAAVETRVATLEWRRSIGGGVAAFVERVPSIGSVEKVDRRCLGTVEERLAAWPGVSCSKGVRIER